MSSRRLESMLPLTPRDYLILFALVDGQRHGYALVKDVASHGPMRPSSSAKKAEGHRTLAARDGATPTSSLPLTRRNRIFMTEVRTGAGSSPITEPGGRPRPLAVEQLEQRPYRPPRVVEAEPAVTSAHIEDPLAVRDPHLGTPIIPFRCVVGADSYQPPRRSNAARAARILA